MKILVIPDVHGSHEWEVAKTLPKDSYDYVVFLGDYFDSWENKWDDQGENFLNICRFVDEDKEHRKMLIGNHDFSYISGTRDGDNCSGHQFNKVGLIRALLTENYDLLDLAFEADGYVFSHAGFSKTWVHAVKRYFHVVYDKYPDEDTNSKGLIWDENEWSIKFLNDYWHSRTHIPGDDTFSYGFDELLDWRGFMSGSGNEVTQGITWIRPEALLSDAYYPNQIVGHTEYALFEPTCLTSKGNNVILMDSRNHKVWGVFDTEKPVEYKTISEFNHWYKTFEKSVLDFKSQQGERADYTKETIMPKIQETFGADRAELIYELYFKK